MDANEIYKKYIAPEPEPEPNPEPPKRDTSLEDVARDLLKAGFKDALNATLFSEISAPSCITQSIPWGASITIASPPFEITSIKMEKDILKWPRDTVVAIRYKIGREKYGLRIDVYPYLQLSVEDMQELIRKEIVNRITIQFKEDFVYEAVSEALVKIKLC